jgi:hypothetical protein
MILNFLIKLFLTSGNISFGTSKTSFFCREIIKSFEITFFSKSFFYAFLCSFSFFSLSLYFYLVFTFSSLFFPPLSVSSRNYMRGQFHQHFTRKLYKRRSQKHISLKTDCLTVFLYFWDLRS